MYMETFDQECTKLLSRINFYVVRHGYGCHNYVRDHSRGTTALEAFKRFRKAIQQNHILDPQLSHKGYLESFEAGEELSRILESTGEIHFAFSSPLLRAIETGVMMIKYGKHNMYPHPIMIAPGLCEKGVTGNENKPSGILKQLHRLMSIPPLVKFGDTVINLAQMKDDATGDYYQELSHLKQQSARKVYIVGPSDELTRLPVENIAIHTEDKYPSTFIVSDFGVFVKWFCRQFRSQMPSGTNKVNVVIFTHSNMMAKTIGILKGEILNNSIFRVNWDLVNSKWVYDRLFNGYPIDLNDDISCFGCDKSINANSRPIVVACKPKTTHQLSSSDEARVDRQLPNLEPTFSEDTVDEARVDRAISLFDVRPLPNLGPTFSEDTVDEGEIKLVPSVPPVTSDKEVSPVPRENQTGSGQRIVYRFVYNRY